MNQDERRVRYGRMMRELCLWEIRKGEAIAAYRRVFEPGKRHEYTPYYEAVMMTHKPGGPRDIIKRLYGENSTGRDEEFC